MGIQVPPDDTGKIVETNVPNTDHRQVVTLGDDTATTKATVGANGLEVDVQASVLPTGAAQSETDNSVYTMGTDPVVPVGAIYDNTPVNPTDGNVAALRCNVFRQLEVSVQGNAAGGVDGAAHGASQTGIRILGTDGTNDEQIAVDSSGNVQVDIVADGAGLALATNQLADGHAVTVDNLVGAPAFTQLSDGTAVIAADATNGLKVDLGSDNDVVAGGNVAHDAGDTGNPVKIGHKAVEYNTDPPTVDTDDDRVDSIATPQGIQWVLGGHPNIVTREYVATGAQTNDEIIASVAPGSQIIITKISAMLDNASSADVKVRIGFGTTGTVPTEPGDGANVDGVVMAHGGIAPGSGIVEGTGAGVIAVGGDGLELGISCATPTPGRLSVVVAYYVSTL